AVAHSGFQEAVETMRVQGLTDVLGFDVASRVFGLVFAQENLFANFHHAVDRLIACFEARAAELYAPAEAPAGPA
ncbi:hypothetical protein VQ049_13350, partial [Staphylococcus arlettae]|uniref:hypothetical protein n=1 Tax=Staphylococcus arlettae TaxID=29378 RepID=UPI003CF707F4